MNIKILPLDKIFPEGYSPKEHQRMFDERPPWAFAIVIQRGAFVRWADKSVIPYVGTGDLGFTEYSCVEDCRDIWDEHGLDDDPDCPKCPIKAKFECQYIGALKESVVEELVRSSQEGFKVQVLWLDSSAVPDWWNHKRFKEIYLGQTITKAVGEASPADVGKKVVYTYGTQ